MRETKKHRNNYVTSAISRPSAMGTIGGTHEFLDLARPKREGELTCTVSQDSYPSHYMEETRMALQVPEPARRQAQGSMRMFQDW